MNEEETRRLLRTIIDKLDWALLWLFIIMFRSCTH